jgi:glutathione S-transferase
MVLYDDALDADCYAVRLFCSILGLQPVLHAVDVVPGGELRSPAFLARNPAGDLPLLDDDGHVVRDTAAILAYLAATYDASGEWCPRDSHFARGTARWLAVAADLRATAGAARACEALDTPGDVPALRAAAHRLLRDLDEHLWFAEDEGAGWLVAARHPTVADLACFPHVMLAPEGGIALLDYPALRRWTQRVKKIPGFIAMPGIFPAWLPPDVRAQRDA